MIKVPISEELLHQIWQYRLFQQSKLVCKGGESIEIISSGNYNSDAGPDFHAAKIKIDDTVWVGNIEIHIRTSDWQKHGHNKDKAYDTVILHVVWIDDFPKTVKSKFPVLELRNYIPNHLIENYKKIMACKGWIPCENSIKNVEQITKMGFIERLGIERIENKSIHISKLLETNGNNWENTLYQLLGKYFGGHINPIPFELITKKVPRLIILKNKDSLENIESLLFGTAGFLEDEFSDEYLCHLQHRFLHLRNKYQIVPIQKHLWKFLRMRPTSFPTIKIAQFSRLYYGSDSLVSRIIELEAIEKIKNIFRLDTSEYWLSHYLPEKTSKLRKKSLGSSFVDSLLINAIIPFLFCYGQKHGDQKILNRSLLFMEKIEGEKNNVVKKFEALGVFGESALHTQGIIQLKKEFCDRQKCLNCSIGLQLLKK